MIFRYPGGKTKKLPFITERLFPRILDDVYYEAFVGGGSVLCCVADNFSRAKIFANDLDPTIAAFWTIIGNPSLGLEDLLSKIRVQPTVELFLNLRQTPPDSLIDKAYYAVFFNRTTFSGISTSAPIGGKGQKSKWAIDCRYNIKFLTSTIEYLAKLFENRLHVSNMHFNDFLATASHSIYLDPPYYEKGSQLYPVRMSVAEHQMLPDLLRHKKNWVLSYDDCPEIRKLYENFDISMIEGNYSISGKKITWSSKKELLIYA